MLNVQSPTAAAAPNVSSILSPTTVSPSFSPSLVALQCVAGTVTLFRFFMQPPAGTIIGQIQPVFGTPIFLVQTQPTPLGGTPLSAVDGRFATLCGRFVNVSGQVALDVVVVNPGAPSPTGTPLPTQQLLLLLLILLLTNPRLAGSLLGTSGLGLSGINPFTLQQLLGSLGTPGLGALGANLGLTGLGALNPLGLGSPFANLGLSGLGTLGTSGLGALGALAALGTSGLGALGAANPQLPSGI